MLNAEAESIPIILGTETRINFTHYFQKYLIYVH